jgi:hypothetical protein
MSDTQLGEVHLPNRGRLFEVRIHGESEPAYEYIESDDVNEVIAE